MMNIKKITLGDIEHQSFIIARKFMTHNEPISDFSTRYPSKLESCLLTPFQTFSGKFLYRGLIEKAAVLFYLMIKNHPFVNGNKRIAVTTLLLFLHLNGKWLSVTPNNLYTVTMYVASSENRVKSSMIEFLKNFIKDFLVSSNK